MAQSFSLPVTPSADAVASVSAEGEVTYADLWARARQLGLRLRELPAHSEVLVACEGRCDLAVSLLACWQAGVVAALPPNLQGGTLAELCKGERVTAAIQRGQPEGWCTVPSIDLNHTLASGSVGEAAVGQIADAVRTFDSAQHLVTVYTSGTTGRHQPCEKTAGQLLGEVELLNAHFAITSESVILATVPSHHIYGLLFGLLVPLCARARFVDASPLHVEVIRAMIERHAVTDLVSVPAHLQGLSELPKGALGFVRRVFSSAAPLYPTTADLLRQVHGVTVVEVLGSTESGGIAWRSDSGPWRPLPGVTVGHADDGTIEIHSPFLATRDQPIFRGHDKIELVKGGFRHLGREDGVVKVAGKRVALQELEVYARQLPGVSDVAAVILDGGGLRGMEIGLVVVGVGWQSASLKQALLERFDAVVVPRRFRFIEALPREQNGKLSRARLLTLFAQSAGQAGDD